MIILPKKPTKQMVEAGMKVNDKKILNNIENIYEAMKSAAPCPWIKIDGKDTLPKEEGWYIVINEGNNIIAYYWLESECWDNPYYDSLEVTHYIQMPEPPK